jgi:hypothetical protein
LTRNTKGDRTAVKRREALRWLGACALLKIAAPELEAWPSGSALLSLRVTDAATGAQMPCTVTIRKSSGEVIVKSRSFLDGFRSDGTFRTTVPPGSTELIVSRGFDYVAAKKVLHLREGDSAEEAIALKRRSPLHNLKWFCGDSHVHMFHGERTVPVDFPQVALAARAESLDYMCVAQLWDDADSTPATLDGKCQSVSSPDMLLSWNMEMPKNYVRGDVTHCLGHCWNLGMRGYDNQGHDVIQELTEMSGSDYEDQKSPTPNFESHALIHSVGGIVAYTHPCRWWWGSWGGRGIYPIEKHKYVSNLAQELPFDTIAGPTYDCLDILMQTKEHEVNEHGQQLWFLLLNKGYRIAATASSDATFDNPGRGVPGAVRVYTKIDDGLSVPALAKAVKAGRNFVTSGPLMSFSVEGHLPGEAIRLDRTRLLKCNLCAWASGAFGEFLTRVELIRNGEVVGTMHLDNHPIEFAHDFEVIANDNCWIVARCFGSDPITQVAISNPVYVETSPYRSPPAATAFVSISVTDAANGIKLGGTYEVLECIGRLRKTRFSGVFQEGRTKIEVPATARIRVAASGYRPVTKSVFLDHRPVYYATVNMRLEQLLSWDTFVQMRDSLENVILDYRLDRE